MSTETQNRVLRSLDAATRRSVTAACEPVKLRARTVLNRAGETTQAVHFPETAVISTVAAYSDGATIEMANVGREACTGVNLTLGRRRQLDTSEVQVAGTALRLPAERFLALKEELPPFRDALLATAQALYYQVMVSAACNGAHDARQRLARWLLTMHDRTDGDEMALTQEFLAHMLGVRRATVTGAATAFKAAGLIAYAHGRLTIRDRPGLQRESCECYDLVRQAYDELLPWDGAPQA